MLSFQAATTEMQEWMKTTLATTGPRLGLFTSTSTLTVRREQLGLVLARDQVLHKQKQVITNNVHLHWSLREVIIDLYRR